MATYKRMAQRDFIANLVILCAHSSGNFHSGRIVAVIPIKAQLERLKTATACGGCHPRAFSRFG